MTPRKRTRREEATERAPTEMGHTLQRELNAAMGIGWAVGRSTVELSRAVTERQLTWFESAGRTSGADEERRTDASLRAWQERTEDAFDAYLDAFAPFGHPSSPGED